MTEVETIKQMSTKTEIPRINGTLGPGGLGGDSLGSVIVHTGDGRIFRTLTGKRLALKNDYIVDPIEIDSAHLASVIGGDSVPLDIAAGCKAGVGGKGGGDHSGQHKGNSQKYAGDAFGSVSHCKYLHF